MKTQIRRSVFETNSSSTHSISLLPNNLSDAEIINIIREEADCSDETDNELEGYEMTDNKGNIVLNCIPYPYGDEQTLVVYKIVSVPSKIAFLFNELMSYGLICVDEEKRYHFEDITYDIVIDFLQKNTKLYDKFYTLANEYANKYGFKDVKVGKDYINGQGDNFLLYNEKHQIVFKDIYRKNDIEIYEAYFRDVMAENKIMVISDVPYRMHDYEIFKI